MDPSATAPAEEAAVEEAHRVKAEKRKAAEALALVAEATRSALIQAGLRDVTVKKAWETARVAKFVACNEARLLDRGLLPPPLCIQFILLRCLCSTLLLLLLPGTTLYAHDPMISTVFCY